LGKALPALYEEIGAARQELGLDAAAVVPHSDHRVKILVSQKAP
jgi:hypothetical protein